MDITTVTSFRSARTRGDLALSPGEVVIDIAATAVNRADLLQTKGHYPPPPGAS